MASKKWSKRTFRKSGIYGISMETLRIKLARVTEQTNNHVSDHLMYHFGTSRPDEILASIGDDGRPFADQLVDYLDNYQANQPLQGNPLGLLLTLTYAEDQQ